MKASKFSDAQKAFILKQGADGIPSPVKNPVLSGDAHVSRAAPEQKGGQDQQQELPEPCQEEPEVVADDRLNGVSSSRFTPDGGRGDATRVGDMDLQSLAIDPMAAIAAVDIGEGGLPSDDAGDLVELIAERVTATAKPEVVRDIRDHFKSRLERDLMLLDGGATRENLSFEVRPTQRGTKLANILDVIEAKLPRDGASGAVVYCATRSETERVADFLKQQGLSAERFHAGLMPEEKREIQERFRIGALRIIAATNAFGMGIWRLL